MREWVGRLEGRNRSKKQGNGKNLLFHHEIEVVSNVGVRQLLWKVMLLCRQSKNCQFVFVFPSELIGSFDFLTTTKNADEGFFFATGYINESHTGIT
jgi:hypothetical protein